MNINVYDVVKKLIGDIEPVGAEHIDKVRFENLKAVTELTNKLLTDIDDVAYKFKDRHEESVKKASEFANKFLDKIGIQED